ncbi:MAG: right-handed parallel beta-helix repeat-containing protein, partial [Planctomycetota bacterium]
MLSRLAAIVVLVPLARSQGTDAGCVPLTNDFVVTQSVRFCPGSYTFDDPQGDGVIRVAANDVTIDMQGVDLSGSTMQGVGILVDGVDGVRILNAGIHGYRVAIYLRNGSGHRVEGCNLSRNRKRPTFNSGADFLSVWPDLTGQFGADQIGNGLLLSNVSTSSLARNRCTQSQNGIGLFQCHDIEIVSNDCSRNEGWGIHLHRSSHNAILHNTADHNFDHESSYCHQVQQDGCDTAALLVIKDSNDNLVVGNSLRDSGDGVFSAAQESATHWGADRNVYRGNDSSQSKHIGFESTFSDQNQFLDNTADQCGRYGFWLGYSRNALVQGNKIRSNASAGISNESVLGIVYRGNDIGSNRVGVELRAGSFTLAPQDSRDQRFYDNWIHHSLDRGLSIVDTHEVVMLENTIESNSAGNLRFALALETALGGPLTVRHNNILLGNAAYNVKNEQATDVDLTENWWGTTDANAIAATIQGREQYAIVPPHRLATLEIVFQDAAGAVTLKRVVNERADDAFDVTPAGAIPRSNASPQTRLGRGPAGEHFTAGFRFRDVYVPAGSVILSAHLSLPSISAPQSEQLDLRLFAQADDDAQPFDATSMPSARPLSFASVAWGVAASWNPDERVASPDVRTLIEETLARPGWQSGHAIALIAVEHGSSGSRAVHAFDFEGYANLPGTPAEFRHYRKHRFTKLELEFDDGLGALVLERELGSGNDDADNCVNCNEVNFGFNGSPLTGGFRFPDVRVPAGAILTGARLWLPTDGTYNNQLQVRLRGEKLANAPSYSAGSLPAARPKTTAFVSWPISSTWNYLEWHATPEILGPVSEVLLQPTWQF